MKIDKSLQEVWDWKDKIYDETKSLNTREFVSAIAKEARETESKYKLDLRKFAKSIYR